jgi:hypothetical protein
VGIVNVLVFDRYIYRRATEATARPQLTDLTSPIS